MYVEQKRTLIRAFQGLQPMAEADLDHVLEHVFSYVYVQLKLPINPRSGQRA